MLDINVAGGARLTCLETDWGWVGMACTQRGLCGLTLPDETSANVLAALQQDWPGSAATTDVPMPGFASQLRRYFRGEAVRFDVELDLPQGPPFRRLVWEVVRYIPYGETRSYGEIADLAGRPGAARAVGGAMACNPVPIVVPCHRVVGSSGRLVGFGGGLTMKRRLIEMECNAVGGKG